MPTWNPRVIVIGAGAGGIAAGVRLLQDGVTNLTILERSDGVGGVWRANHYPGSQCDVPSHLYSLSFHPKPDWSKRFGDQAEILGYLEDAATKHGLRPYLRCNTEVLSCVWDDQAQEWRVTVCSTQVAAGTKGKAKKPATSVLTADIVIAASGQLSVPSTPKLPGLDTFAGTAFHSAQWRHDVDLAGRRVAIVGTGASTIQFIEPVVETAAHVDVYQRSAPYIIGKSNRRYSKLEQKFYATVPAAQRISRARQYLWHEFLGLPFTRFPGMMVVPTATWRMRMRRAVSDLALREKVTPDYVMGCKRLLRAPNWYRTLSRPDVSVHTGEIAEVVPEGVKTPDGQVHPADVLIFGTGFAATEFLTPMRVTGRGGRELSEVWKDGARAYLGTAVSGFPNLFLLYGPGTNLGHSSIIFMIESQISWVRGAIASMRQRGQQWIDVRPEVFSEYDAKFRKDSSATVWEAGCSSWYTKGGLNTNNWPGTTVSFYRRTRRFNPADVTSAPRQVPAPVAGGSVPARGSA